MFVKPISIPNKKTGKRYRYYRLCESYRAGDSPRHRTILNLGKLEELSDKKDKKVLADCIEHLVYKKNTLFEPDWPAKIKQLAEHFAKIIINKKLVDVPQSKPASPSSDQPTDYQDIDINSTEHKQVREVGAEWLCKQTLERLNFKEYLLQSGWQERWANLAMIYMIGRAVFAASELKTQDWLHTGTALAELYDMEPEKLTRHHLYKVSHMLYNDKENIEGWLSAQTNELFDLKDKIVLYDLTNTYFEGEKKHSKKAKHAKSKEKRSDAKLLALAMVTDTSGFVKYSHIYQGNIKDHKTLERTITDIESTHRHPTDARKIIVMDAGIATEDNLNILRDKQHKEKSMEDLFCTRYEEGLQAIKEGIGKKRGTKKIEKVYERLGRLKEKYPSVNRFYKISFKKKNGIATGMEWEKTGSSNKRQGIYFIRTSLAGKDEKTIWNIYNTIREIEATFRTLKTDLNMRPVFHQKDVYSEAHIYGSILAYTIVNTIRHLLKTKGIRNDWRNIVRTMNTQKAVTSTMQTRTGRTIHLKKCSEPEAPVREIYQALQYKDRPFWQKKSVLPKNVKADSRSPDTS